MNSTKGLGVIIAVCALIAVALNVIVWLTPFIHGPNFWISYAFIWIALICLAGANIYAYSQSRSMKSALYHVSLTAISIVYMIVAGAISLMFMSLPLLPIWIVALVEVLVMVFFLLGFVGGGAGAHVVEKMDEVNAAQVGMMDSLRAQAEAIAATAPAGPIGSDVASLAEAIRFSDPVSSDSTVFMEQQLAQLLSQIGQASVSDDESAVRMLCGQAMQLLAQRNIVCRGAK